MSKALIRTVVMTASLLSAGWLLADDGDADKRSALPSCTTPNGRQSVPVATPSIIPAYCRNLRGDA